MQRNVATWIYLVLLFLGGVAVGAFGLRLYTLNSVDAGVSPHHPEEFRRRYVAELRTRLALTNDQVARLGPILDETRKRNREFMDGHKPELKAIHDDQVKQIRAILTDAQQGEFTKLLDEREKMRQREGR